MMKNIKNEFATLEAQIIADTKNVNAVKRLKTIPTIGDGVALYIYAWVGDVWRFLAATGPSVSAQGRIFTNTCCTASLLIAPHITDFTLGD
jgi:hypothetical protein